MEKISGHLLNSLIIGFTGAIGSGCSYIAKEISEESKKKFGEKAGYKIYKPSDIIREYLDNEQTRSNKNKKQYSVKELQDAGNKIRKDKRLYFLITEIIEKINREIEQDSQSQDYRFIIDGIKNEGELTALRQFDNFFLISVHADIENRRERWLKVNPKFKEKDFKEIDERDELQTEAFGQKVRDCDYLADIVISNNTNFIENDPNKRKDEFIDGIWDKYIEPIEEYRKGGKYSIKNPPSIDEFCMAMAYSASKMSSCLKRKVGAVVLKLNTFEKPQRKDGEDAPTSFPVIISTGYNEVPLHSKTCFYKYEKCHRDALQEVHAKGIKNCPYCNTKINLVCECKSCGKKFKKYVKRCSKCTQDVEYIKCKCGTDIFNIYVPGAKKSPGKLLDVCRALHAEENALLNIQGNFSNNGLVLYTTTYPCNMCANKIVNKGIRKVVYNEPYPMLEAQEILKNADVEMVPFQGIKSVAFFRLYR